MQINYTILVSLIYSIFPVHSVLKCLSGHSQYAIECTSQSYCLTITAKHGPVQRSCDGNSISQISLCSAYAMTSVPRTVQADYSGYPVSSSNSASSSNLISQKHISGGPRSLRRAPMKMCFNAGDLGEVCCCNTDFCNSASSSSIFIIPTALLVFLFVLS